MPDTSITRPKLERVVADVVASALRETAAAQPPSAGRIVTKASQAAADVARDPRIAPALAPVSRFDSQTIRGLVIAAGAPLLVAIGRLAGVEIAQGDAATALSTLVSLAGAAYAWHGRATTTRPLK
ncbi:hypothetical protein [Hansschlegelia zhihuaiae]|uniref:Uncharacterized protein n=1 Tax=Hansschlegelia zhihuaiae TaxID=405005 RepID=A0A4Q0MNI2_9HYPH|nr:hypothetical protein [Hansschlegelia zhihuaiae]RXF75441.1 hypothetical protein EK403_00865 [Hansschlegelia zhihuaiae]